MYSQASMVNTVILFSLVPLIWVCLWNLAEVFEWYWNVNGSCVKFLENINTYNIFRNINVVLELRISINTMNELKAGIHASNVNELLSLHVTEKKRALMPTLLFRANSLLLFLCFDCVFLSLPFKKFLFLLS